LERKQKPMSKPHAHCSFCGARYPENLGWPRTCPACGHTAYRNPLPVAVVLVPVGDGLLVIRRLVEPRVGQLALPGGYINFGESWQEAGAREVMEETGVSIDPANIREFRVRSAPDGTVLIFGISEPTDPAALAEFKPTAEATECAVIHAPVELAFSLHSEAVAAYFERRERADTASSTRAEEGL
jgi:ADP-ribose pyrophosphatase YjhB (NUDIX family)